MNKVYTLLFGIFICVVSIASTNQKSLMTTKLTVKGLIKARPNSATKISAEHYYKYIHLNKYANGK